MKTSSELKLMARRALRGNYGNASGAVLVMYIVSLLCLIPFGIVIAFASLAGGNGDGGVLAAALCVPAAVIVYFLVLLVLSVGYLRLCYQIAVGAESDMNDLFFVLKNHFTRYIGALFLLMLCGILACMPGFLLWFLLLEAGNIVGGAVLGYLLVLVLFVVVMCRYAMALYIMVENPQMRVREALQASRELMRGNVWRMIKLEFSFFGIYLLGMITFGTGYIWILPYISCTNALFYLEIKEEKFPTVYKSAEEEAFDARFERNV